MSASQSVTRTGAEKPDHKSTLDSGLKMKIMRSKSIDGCPDQKLKIVKNESNGIQTTSQSPNSGSPITTSSKSKQRDTKASQKQSVSSPQQPSAQDSTMVRDPGVIGHPPIGFTAKNIPVSNLFATQSKYSYSSSNNSNSSSSPPSNVQSPNNDNINSAKLQSEDVTVDSSKSPKSCESSVEKQQNSDEFSNEEPPNKKRKAQGTMVDRCVGTSFGTLTEPECLGPCEPGTSVNLDGIVWHETEDGILVVNATWRGRSYVGTLLDSTRHEWAPPRPNDGNEDWDCRTRAGRAKRRNAVYGPDINSPLTPKTRSSHNKTRAAKETVVADLFSGSSAKFSSPRSDIRRSREDISSNDEASQQNQTQSLVNPMTGLQVEIPNITRQVIRPCPVSPILLECPEVSCNKKFKNAHGLRYHQSRVHGADCFDDESVNSIDSQYASRSKTPSPTGEVQEEMPRVSANGELKDVNKESTTISPLNAQYQSEDRKHNACVEEKDGMVNGDFSSLKDSVKTDCDMENSLKFDEKSADVTKVVINMSSSGQKPCTDSPAKTLSAGQISVKTDIFERQISKETDQPDNLPNDVEMKDHPLKLSTFITNFSSISRENARSPAYSDISDDSLSMSSSDFIDKLIKSTDSKLLQQATSAYQQHQTENQTIIASLYPGQSAMDKINDQNSLQNSLFPATTIPGQCNMSSSTFINPYNLLSSTHQIVSNVKKEDPKNEENPSTLHSKKDEEVRTTPVIKEDSTRTDIQPAPAHSNQQDVNGCANQNKAIKIENVSPPNIKQPKIEPGGNHQENISSHQKPKSSHSKQSKKLDHRNQSAPKRQSNEKTASNQTSKPPSTAPHPQLTPKSEPNCNRPQSASNMKPPLPPMSRPSGPPPQQYYSPYMGPNYTFNNSYQQYQNSHVPSSPYNLPYYTNQMPRYSMPMDQKNNIRHAQYIPTSSPYGSNIANYPAQSSATGYPNLQTGSTPNTAPPTNPNTQHRFPNTSNNDRSAQTHFHTHHHTHVGLNYPVYSTSYESGMVANQQNTTNNMMSPYSPPPAK